MGDSERNTTDGQHESVKWNAPQDFEPRELTHIECWATFGESGIGHLALRAQPVGVDIMPINYLIANRQLFFRSDLGTKLEDIVLHPFVAVQVEQFEDGIWRSVVLKGKATRLFSEDDIARSGIRELNPTQAGAKTNYVGIIPDAIIGRTFLGPRQSSAI